MSKIELLENHFVLNNQSCLCHRGLGAKALRASPLEGFASYQVGYSP